MKIAAISLTRNDNLRLEAWKSYYKEYKNEISEHIVVDNGSTKEYIETLHLTFPESKIIELGYNGGCTGAYNAGIREALKDPAIDAILLVGNDVKFEPGGLTELYKCLFSNDKYGMVGPVLLKKDSDIVESCGININLKKGSSYALERDKLYSEINHKEKVVSCVPGGANLSKADMYRSVGLQDENLFMYCDELDMSIRMSNEGFVEVVLPRIKCWHQHVNYNNKRSRNPYTRYLMGRNYVYLAKKHFNKSLFIKDFARRFMVQFGIMLKHLGNNEYRKNFKNYVGGMLAGLKSNMDNSMFQ